MAFHLSMGGERYEEIYRAGGPVDWVCLYTSEEL